MASEIPGMMRQLFCKVTIDTVLYDTPEAEQLKAMPPLTVRNDSGRELYGSLLEPWLCHRAAISLRSLPGLRAGLSACAAYASPSPNKSCAFPTNIDEQTGSCYHRR